MLLFCMIMMTLHWILKVPSEAHWVVLFPDHACGEVLDIKGNGAVFFALWFATQHRKLSMFSIEQL